MTKTSLKKEKCKKAKRQSEETLHIAEERRDTKGKKEREIYPQLNAEFQRITRRDKTFLSEKCKKYRKTVEWERLRDLSKKIGDTKRTFHAKMGSIKDRNDKELTEAERLRRGGKNRQKNCTEKVLTTQINHNGVATHLEPDILECEVKWALGSITTNKASGGDGIPNR